MSAGHTGGCAAWELVASTFMRTLEEAAFAFAEPSADPPPFSGELLEARLAWGGPSAAEVRLVVERRFAAVLAANLVGEDDPDDECAADALGELLNMTAGALVHELSGGAGAPLGLPEVEAVAPDAWASTRAARGLAATSLVEEHGHRIDLTLERAGEAADAGAAR